MKLLHIGKFGNVKLFSEKSELMESMEVIEMAALDTIADEPVKLNNILLNQEQKIMDKIIFSPHIGGITASSFKRGYSIIWNNIKKVISGEKPDNIVNSL